MHQGNGTVPSLTAGVQVQRRHAVLLICKYQSVARLSRPANPAGWALTTFLILLRNQNDE